jgi:hypothetical protein
MSNSKKTDYGYELFWAKTQDYASKILVFESAGKGMPLHFCQNLERTWFVNSGEFSIHYIDTTTGTLLEAQLKEGSVFHIPPLMPIKIAARHDNSSLTEVNNSKEEAIHILSNS